MTLFCLNIIELVPHPFFFLSKDFALKLENSAAFPLLALPCMLTQLAAIANSDTTHLFVALGDFRMRVPGPEKFHSDTATQTPPCGVSLSLSGFRCSVCPVCHYQIEFRMQIVFGWKAV